MKTRKAKMKVTKEDLLFNWINYIVLGIFFLIIAYPLYFVVIASISDPVAALNGDVIFKPVGVNVAGFKKIFSNSKIWIGYGNTIIYTVVGTFINVALTMGISYPLSRKKFSGRRWIMIFLMITMYFNGGLIPTYILVRSLHLRNTLAVMVLMGAVSVFNVIIARTFLEANIPAELEEAASIDGCSQIGIFFKIVMPLSKSIVAVLILFYGVWHWNDFMTGLIYLDEEKKFPLQLIIRSILIQVNMEANDVTLMQSMQERMKLAESVKYGVIIVSSVPVLMLYPFLQKYFSEGVLIGSVKG